MNFYSTGASAVDDNISFGLGWGGGLTMHFPLENGFSINPELNFLWRKIYNHKYSQYPRPSSLIEADIHFSASELALSAPIMAQYKIIPNLYVSTGIQLDFPLLATIKQRIKVDDVDYCSALEGIDDTVECSYAFDGRTFLDFGLALGTGYMFGKSFGVDLKYVFGLLEVNDKEDGKYNQMIFSLLWYF
jgi:hypothetical protein